MFLFARLAVQHAQLKRDHRRRFRIAGHQQRLIKFSIKGHQIALLEMIGPVGHQLHSIGDQRHAIFKQQRVQARSQIGSLLTSLLSATLLMLNCL